MADERPGCPWPSDPLMMSYHDTEWGTPVHDDDTLFEHLALDGFQAGLSWATILRKRENFRKAFAGFIIEKVAEFGPDDRERLLADEGIVRNRLKVDATISNAQRCLEVQREFGTLDRYLWQFTGHKTSRQAGGVTYDTMVSSTSESDAMSKDLRKRGFRFVGTTICYAFMQAVGMVNDHVNECFRTRELEG